MTVNEVRKKYIEFFKSAPRNHEEVSPAPLVLADDPTTLFTSSGMQPLVPYLLGENHPKGKRLVNSQPSIRLQDIEEVGDNRHTTFFEMLGNWSLGDYFKEEELAWFWEFLTKELKLPKEKLWITIFSGDDKVKIKKGKKLLPFKRDEEVAKIWKNIGVDDEHIGYYGVEKNWWSRTGTPNEMPIGDIGGPTSEFFYEFTEVEHNFEYGKECHINCDCGRFMEIGNAVFMQYKKVGENTFEELPNKNVDFGGGLERLAAATIDSPDVFDIDVFWDLIGEIEKATDKTYKEENNKHPMRIIADHIRASVFLANDGVEPANKQHGYILRRLIRRSCVKIRSLTGSLEKDVLTSAIDSVFSSYRDIYLDEEKKETVKKIVLEEISRFKNTLEKGLREIEKIEKIDASAAFNLYQSYGFPLEIIAEIFSEKGQSVDRKKFEKEFENHKEMSRSASAGVFKGGLVDHSDDTIKLHTATHLLQAALRMILGDHVIQKGQNINGTRSRFDFIHNSKLTDEEMKQVENLANEKIKKNLPVSKVELLTNEAIKTGAIHAFGEKYGDTVNVYYTGENIEDAFSKEFCGGPHVAHTGDIGRVKIKSQEKIGADTVRVYLVFDKN